MLLLVLHCAAAQFQAGSKQQQLVHCLTQCWALWPGERDQAGTVAELLQEVGIAAAEGRLLAARCPAETPHLQSSLLPHPSLSTENLVCPRFTPELPCTPGRTLNGQRAPQASSPQMYAHPNGWGSGQSCLYLMYSPVSIGASI